MEEYVSFSTLCILGFVTLGLAVSSLCASCLTIRKVNKMSSSKNDKHDEVEFENVQTTENFTPVGSSPLHEESIPILPSSISVDHDNGTSLTPPLSPSKSSPNSTSFVGAMTSRTVVKETYKFKSSDKSHHKTTDSSLQTGLPNQTAETLAVAAGVVGSLVTGPLTMVGEIGRATVEGAKVVVQHKRMKKSQSEESGLNKNLPKDAELLVVSPNPSAGYESKALTPKDAGNGLSKSSSFESHNDLPIESRLRSPSGMDDSRGSSFEDHTRPGSPSLDLDSSQRSLSVEQPSKTSTLGGSTPIKSPTKYEPLLTPIESIIGESPHTTPAAAGYRSLTEVFQTQSSTPQPKSQNLVTIQSIEMTDTVLNINDPAKRAEKPVETTNPVNQQVEAVVMTINTDTRSSITIMGVGDEDVEYD